MRQLLLAAAVGGTALLSGTAVAQVAMEVPGAGVYIGPSHYDDDDYYAPRYYRDYRYYDDAYRTRARSGAVTAPVAAMPTGMATLASLVGGLDAASEILERGTAAGSALCFLFPRVLSHDVLRREAADVLPPSLQNLHRPRRDRPRVGHDRSKADLQAAADGEKCRTGRRSAGACPAGAKVISRIEPCEDQPQA
jgi:hypothetical protein